MLFHFVYNTMPENWHIYVQYIVYPTKDYSYDNADTGHELGFSVVLPSLQNVTNTSEMRPRHVDIAL